MRRNIILALGVLAFATLALDPVETSRAQVQQINPADFQTNITNPYFPVSLVGRKVFEGEEQDGRDVIKTRLESRILPQTKVIMGVTTAVLEEKEYEDGELIEVALDYIAQHKDGSVYYFGEDVDFYEDGRLVDHHGAWLAGVGPNRPGILMPAQPTVDQTIQMEYAPGVAEDMATFLLVGTSVRTKSGAYGSCVKTRDFTPLEPGLEEFKWYCAGAGLVKEQGDDFEIDLVSIATPLSPVAIMELNERRSAAPPSTAQVQTVSAQSAPAQSQSLAAPPAPPSSAQPVQPPSAGDAGLLNRERVGSKLLPAAAVSIVLALVIGSALRRHLRTPK
jgi:hypothetical protein